MNLSSLTPLQLKVLEVLMKDTSAKMPITGLNISRRLGLVSKRLPGSDMRSVIHALRVKGLPICANGRGYFYARTNEELSKFIVSMEERILAQEYALKGLKESFHNVGFEILGMKFSDTGDAKGEVVRMKTRVATRTPQGTVRYIEVPISADGHPVVSPGTILL